ncbi:hypothetical protein EZV62_013409 [Acer yangbiense]|uniref:Uncharacterized protein n=1 Tax=Acer yangbiense TaxID=1000413 RepID=A0A5C7I028_9ROSI|nr:hypothetical protein EZV62_013409 [Acer yangbiense]
MLKLWKWYQNCLAVHPVKTQVISSGVIWGFGDIAAQIITHYTAKKYQNQDEKPVFATSDENKIKKINWKRVATTSLFGFTFVGPVGHFWYEGLDRFIKSRVLLRENSFSFVATKTVIDSIIFGPLDLLVFFTYMGFTAGKSWPQIKEDVIRDFFPALMLEGGIWPIVQVANFRFVPVRYQLLYVNFFCLLDSCFLSWIEQQHDAPWKKWLKSLLPLKEDKGQGEGCGGGGDCEYGGGTVGDGDGGGGVDGVNGASGNGNFEGEVTTNDDGGSNGDSSL